MQRYNGQLINQFPNTINGNAAAGAQITVRVKSSGALASLYATDNLGGAALSNPITADSRGHYGFYAPDGVYTLDVSISGTPQLEIQLQDVAALQAQFNDALANAGYIPVGTFATGCTVSQSNGVVSDGSSFWRWDGALPKTVTAGSAPTPTGAGGWVLISDGGLGSNTEIVNSRVAQWAVVTDPAFGADKTGATFCNASFTAAQAASNFIIVPAGNYSFNPATPVEVQDNKVWFFMGANLYISGNGRILELDSKRGFRLLGSATFYGSATISDINGSIPTSTEYGIYQDRCSDFIVGDMTFRQFKGAGVYLNGGAQPPIVNPSGGYTFAERGRWGNIGFYGNVKGLVAEAGNGAEYQSFSNIDAGNNNIALSIAAGNISITGGNVSGNRVNLYLRGGTNNGHGRIANVSLNHGKPYNLLCEDVTLGFTLAGCHFYANDSAGDGRIEIINSKGISIEGGQLDCKVIVNESGPNAGLNYINGAYTPATYGGVQLVNQAGTRPKTMIVTGCGGYGLKNPSYGNVNINDVSLLYVAASRAFNVKQAITSSTLTALILPTVDANGDNRQCYNSGTGVTTIPAGMDGNYNIRAFLVFEGATLTAENSWLGLYLGGANDTIFYPSNVSNVDTNKTITFDINIDTYLSSGATVDFRAFIAGTSINFGALCRSKIAIELTSS